MIHRGGFAASEERLAWRADQGPGGVNRSAPERLAQLRQRRRILLVLHGTQLALDSHYPRIGGATPRAVHRGARRKSGPDVFEKADHLVDLEVPTVQLPQQKPQNTAEKNAHHHRPNSLQEIHRFFPFLPFSPVPEVVTGSEPVIRHISYCETKPNPTSARCRRPARTPPGIHNLGA